MPPNMRSSVPPVVGPSNLEDESLSSTWKTGKQRRSGTDKSNEDVEAELAEQLLSLSVSSQLPISNQPKDSTRKEEEPKPQVVGSQQKPQGVDDLTDQLFGLTIAGKHEANSAQEEEKAEAAKRKREAIKRSLALLKEPGLPSSRAVLGGNRTRDDRDLNNTLLSKGESFQSPSVRPTTDADSDVIRTSRKPRSLWTSLEGKSLRGYQTKLVDEVMQKFNEGAPSLLLYLPTGGGKTAIATKIIESHLQSNKARRCAVFVHRDELAWQIQKSLLEWGCPEHSTGFIKAGEETEMGKEIQVVSIQTFARRYIRTTEHQSVDLVSPPPFDLIIIDEAHHAMADEYLALVNLYPDARILGVTATPFRLNKGELLGDVFFDKVLGPSIQELTDQNWLVPSVFIRSSSSRGTLQRSGVKNVHFLDAAVLTWKQRFSDRKSIAFCIDIAHAQSLRRSFENQGVVAELITGKMKRDERERVFARSREGEIQVLCSVDVVSEGVDTVWIDCLIFFRPTESRGLFLQQLGRGLRPYEGKRECVVLDEVGNIFRHGFDFRHVAMDKGTSSPSSTKKCIRVYDCVRHRKCKGLVELKNDKCLFCKRQQQQRQDESAPKAHDTTDVAPAVTLETETNAKMEKSKVADKR